MCFIEDDDGVFRRFFGDLLCHLGVEQVVEGVDDDVRVRELENAE